MAKNGVATLGHGIALPHMRAANVPQYDEVSFERSHDGRVATITWNPPEKMNPLSCKLTDELMTAVEEAAADEKLNVVIFRGHGGWFSVGDNLVEMANGAWGDPNQVMRRIRFYQRFSNTIEELDKITVAVIDGLALGGGLEITMACDLAIIADDARWGMPEVDSGMTPGWGGTTRMIRLIGRRRTKEINLIGALQSAERGVEWGLFNKAVPAAQIDAEVEQLVEVLLSKNQQTMRQLKFVMNKNADADMNTALAFEAMNEVITSSVNWDPATPKIPDAEPGLGLAAFRDKNALWDKRRKLALTFWSDLA